MEQPNEKNAREAVLATECGPSRRGGLAFTKSMSQTRDSTPQPILQAKHANPYDRTLVPGANSHPVILRRSVPATFHNLVKIAALG
jgi:hypothetical protein